MSLHRNDWLKLLGGAALAMTGFGIAGLGPLAGLLGASGSAGAGAGAAAGAAGAAGAGAGAGAAGSVTVPSIIGSVSVPAAHAAGGMSMANLVAPALVSQGIGAGMSGAMGTPTEKMTTPGNVPQMEPPADPFAMFQQMMSRSRGMGGF